VNCYKLLEQEFWRLGIFAVKSVKSTSVYIWIDFGHRKAISHFQQHLSILGGSNFIDASKTNQVCIADCMCCYRCTLMVTEELLATRLLINLLMKVLWKIYHKHSYTVTELAVLHGFRYLAAAVPGIPFCSRHFKEICILFWAKYVRNINAELFEKCN